MAPLVSRERVSEGANPPITCIHQSLLTLQTISEVALQFFALGFALLASMTSLSGVAMLISSSSTIQTISSLGSKMLYMLGSMAVSGLCAYMFSISTGTEFMSRTTGQSDD